ncbi:MAG: hypothetical protein AMK73_09070, partial [Planctomycetes bacterium SM23_32]
PAAVAPTREAGYAPVLLCERLDAVPQGLTGMEAAFPFYLVTDGCPPGSAARLIQSGRMQGAESVWLYLDLRRADWRRAALEVRSACWAGAWQGLAGLAVRCPPPSAAVDRQLALWHILRDVRSEVALWRQAIATVSARPDTPEGRARRLRRLATLQSIVGTTAHSQLRLYEERRPFRGVCRIRPSGGDRLRLGEFEAARSEVLSILGNVASEPAGERRSVFYQGIPLARDRQANWAIAAGDGEHAWQAALALQRAVQSAAGVEVPVSRSFPDLEAGGTAPELVWLIAEGAEDQNWPEPVRAALAARRGAALVGVRLEEGPLVAVLSADFDVEALARTFREQRELFPPAHRMH